MHRRNIGRLGRYRYMLHLNLHHSWLLSAMKALNPCAIMRFFLPALLILSSAVLSSSVFAPLWLSALQNNSRLWTGKQLGKEGSQ